MAETDQNQIQGDATVATNTEAPTKLDTVGGDLLTERQDLVIAQATLPTTDTTNDTNTLVIPTETLVADAGKRTRQDATATPEERYKQAKERYDKRLNDYWSNLLKTRDSNKFTTEFPPRYEGPAKPKGVVEPKEPKTLPRLNDMFDGSRTLNRLLTGDPNQPDYSIRQVSESQFKQSYANEILKTATANGLTPDEAKNIVRRIYAFESGGAGTHEMLSGMPQDLLKEDKPGETTIADQRRAYRPNSTAIGYTQMLQYNTVRLFDTAAPEISTRLRQMAQEDPSRAQELTNKAQMVDNLQTLIGKELKSFADASGPRPAGKEYIKDGKITDLCREDFAKSDVKLPGRDITGRQLSSSLHAFHMDGDVGPILQSLELNHLLKFAKQNDFTGLLNQEKDAFNKRVSQYDALPQADKTKALTEIMSHIKPSANASEADKKAFIATRDALTTKIAALGPGAGLELAREKLNDAENEMLNTKILQLKKFTDPAGPLSNSARLLMDKMFAARFGELTPEKLMPAALELANLAGSGNALLMLKNMDKPTTNFFSRRGYEGNPTSNGRTAEELLLQIHRNMHGPNGDPLRRPGVDGLLKAFDAIK
jgi:hypothetical protein